MHPAKKQNKNTLISNNHAKGCAVVKERKTELVEGFRHSVPYINTHRGKTFVIMLGGEAIEHENFSSIVNDIGLLHSLGIRLVVVYGARPQIDANLAAHHHEPLYHKNIRVTDAKTLELVKQAAGTLQLDITARLSMSLNNTPLQGAHINVVSGNFIIAQPLGVDDGVDYCHSGRIRRIDEDAIHRQLDSGAIVLMGPVAVSVTGESFNLTSEEIATQLAIKLKAEKMIGFCSSQGVTNDDGDIVSELFPNEAQARVEAQEEKGDYNSGTVRFLRGAVKACRSGVRRCHLISYQEDGALLQELFSRDGIGTQIVMESAEQIRRATINDIGGILELIRPLEQQGILVRRSREQLEMEIDKFTIIQRDNTTIACAALYPFPEEKIGEMACVAVHPDYRSSSRGEVLLERIAAQAKQSGLSKLFVLTTRSIHWFQERGFTPVDIDLLPESKKQLYNYQRKSKVLMADLG
ncbi:N-acetylglutamate synthase [Escherichia coli O26:H11 str. 06-3464]|nr:N-acetylglutamate synthase [Escherichia coli O26:H11 str. 06-3464]EZG54867.1 N-acetylglutamate synthase [Escherichia coli O26:H11 str. 03-3500]EZG61664.1 N-acetylglutamate synthase [Escherichia coli O26:H11 str. 2010C-4819]EZG62394.1 N-acetylglutamate synthase [Escherichia coli O26:H11 str. 2010C-4430]EZG74644.1 N-acetylglutamate synthase [Escherichia coli O26:H11 str. 2010C-4834]EZG76789.1 N-acetylglutamate synthase [Escherichia coli O26:H11 str. 2010C-5028]EZG84761.1 N-acetylglutamate sy